MMREGPLASLLREGFSNLVNVSSSIEFTMARHPVLWELKVCRLEHQLFLRFFPEKDHSPTALTSMIEALGTILYERIRPRLIAAQSVNDLCDYASILQLEIGEGQIERQADMTVSVFQRTLSSI